MPKMLKFTPLWVYKYYREFEKKKKSNPSQILTGYLVAVCQVTLGDKIAPVLRLPHHFNT